nr:MAG TPA: hypothetical protein [Bacteriophage sp.]
MVIRKEYNIEQLVEQLQTEIENSKKYNRVVKLDILTANDILDVLEAVESWENKSSKSNDVMKEELEDNRNCFGYCVEDDYVCTHCEDYKKCRKETDKIKLSEDKAEVNSKPERSDCFGAYDGDIECECCDSKEACENIKDCNMDDEEDVL